MTWWNDIVAWFGSTAGSRVFLSIILPFVAIIVAGVIAALIGRGSARRVLDHQDRELKSSAIVALIVVGRKAALWSSLGADEKQHVDSLMSEADIRVRLLPVNGASSAADWAAHELAAMKKNSASFSFQAEQTFLDYRDRLLEWQSKPGRARKLFSFDLNRWLYESDERETAVVAEQQEWAVAHTEAAGTPARQDAGVATPSTPVHTLSAHLATAPPPTTRPVAGPAPRTAADAVADSEALDDLTTPVAPPVAAGTVRRRSVPTPTPE
jgi:hypothetical protein